MKHLLFFFVLTSVVSGFSQSKKEQIEALTLRVDSLLRVVQQERNTNTDKSNQISSLQSQITALTSQVNQLQLDVSYLDGDLQNKKQTITEQQALLRVKTDSLALLTAELNKLKPAPPVVQPTQTQGNTLSTTTTNTNIKTVTIGTQVWMTTNLNVDKFRNGDLIPEAKTDEEWERAGENQQPAWCYYENKAANGTKYGKLYNWYAVNDPRGLAPEGFHVPSDAEWTNLEEFLGDNAGKKMKSKSGWDFDRNGTNSSVFSGLPAGSRYINGSFGYIREQGNWWSSTEYDTEYSYHRYLSTLSDYLTTGSSGFKAEGFSVRCIKA